jgi:hypothetical protein
MLTKPSISDDTIIACLHDSFGLHIAQVTFLPLGYIHSAVYRVIADRGGNRGLGRAHPGAQRARSDAYWWMNQFLPNNVVDIAHRTYQQLHGMGK